MERDKPIINIYSRAGELMESISEHSLIGIYIMQRDRLVYANRALSNFSGYPLKEIMKWTLDDVLNLVHPDDRHLIWEQAKKKQDSAGDPLESYDYRIIRKNGDVRWMSLYSHAIMYDDVPAILGIVFDITAPRNMERTLRDSELRYRELIENMNSGVVTYDVSGSTPDFIISDFNRAAERITGLTRQDAVGKKIQDVFPNIGNTGLTAVLRHVHATGEASYVSPFWYSDDRIKGWREARVYKLTSGKIVSIYNDVTERVQAEQAIRESEEKFRLLSDQSLLGILIVKDGVIRYVNNAFAALSGVRISELYDSSQDVVLSLIHPDDIHFVEEQIKKKLRGDSDTGPSFEFRMLVNGETRWVEVYSKAVRYENGLAFMCTVLDITSREVARKALLKEKEFTAAIIQNSLDGIAVISRDGAFRLISPAMQRILGYSADDMPDLQTLIDQTFDTGEQKKHLLENWPRNTEKRRMASRVYKIIREDGEQAWAFFQVSPMGEDDFVVSAQDITGLKRAEESLRESEQKIRSIISSLHDTMIVVFNNDGDYVFFQIAQNLALKYGIPKEEIINKNIRDFFPEDIANARIETIRRIYNNGGTLREEYPFQTPNGVFWHSITLSPLIDVNGHISGVTGFIIDITERRNAEAALLQNEKFLSDIFAGIQDGIVVLDNQFTILRANPTFKEKYADNMPVIGKKCYQVIEGTNTPCAGCPSRQTLQTGETNRSIKYREDETGKIIQYMEVFSYPLRDASGDSVGVIEIYRDITHRRRVEEELRRYEESYPRIFDNLHDTYYRTDMEGHILLASPAGEKMLGTVLEDAIGMDLSTFYVEPEKHQEFMELLHRDGHVKEYEAQLRRTDGELIWVSTNATFYTDPDGNVVGVEGIARDITARKRAEEALKKANDELEARVNERTLELTEANESMRREIVERRHAEQALRDSETKYRLLVDMSPDPVVIMQDGIVVFANPAFADIFGYNQEDIENKLNPFDLIKKEEQNDFYIEHRKRIASGDFPKTLPIDMVTKDGRIVNCEVAGAPIRLNGQQAGILIIHDVTAHKQIEAELRRERDFISTILEHSYDGIAVINRHGDILLASPSMERIFGYTKEEIGNLAVAVKRFMKGGIIPDHVRRFFSDDIFSGKPVELVFEITAGTGEKRWVRLVAAPMDDDNIVLNGRDITRQKKSDDEIRYRLGFEKLIGELSKDFLNLQIDEIDDAINNVLSKVGEFTGMKTCDLFEVAQENRLHNIYYWRHHDIESPIDAFPDIDLEQLPLFEKQMRENVPLLDFPIDKLPDGHPIKKNLDAMGLSNGYAIPLMYDGNFIGMFGYSLIDNEEHVENENTSLMLMVAELLAGALHRKRQEIEREFRLEFKKLMAEISANFINVQPLEIDHVINDSLKKIAGITGMQRAYIFVLDADGKSASMTHFFESAESRIKIDNYRQLQIEDLAFSMKYYQQGETLYLYNVHDENLPDTPEIKLLRDRDVVTFVSVPMIYGNTLKGAVGLSSTHPRPWNREALDVMHTAAEIFINAIERARIQTALQTSEERYALAARGTDAGLWDWNLKTGEIYFSPKWKSMIGCESCDIGNSPDDWFSRVHPDDLERLQAKIQLHLDGKSEFFHEEYRIRKNDGTWRAMECSGLAARDADGKPYRMAGSQIDVTKRKQAEEQLMHDALHDTLTGLPNRALFIDRLECAINRATREKKGDFAVLFLDIDRFKHVNDSLGHIIGDQLLIKVAVRLKEVLRPGDTVARIGGDEFIMLLENMSDLHDAETVSERLQSALTRPFDLDGHEVYVSVSIGIALSDRKHAGPEEYLRDADTAMYRAKADGRARHVIFDNSMYLRAVERLQLENDLRRACEKNEFVNHYQPIISLKTGKIVALEALARWIHPERGMIYPDQFIPLAEETGLIIPLGEIVMTEACQHLKSWLDARDDPDLVVNVNLSSLQFSRHDLLENIDDLLRRSGLKANRLRLEITETVLIQNIETVTAMLLQLRALDVSLSIDDFGTGYSSLSYLHRFPIDTLKIDRSFIQRLGVNRYNSEIISAIITLAHNLNMSVVAEGVETEKQVALLKELHCDLVQGYHYSKPVSGDDVQYLLNENWR